MADINNVTQAIRSGSKEMTEGGTLLVDSNQSLKALAHDVRNKVLEITAAAQAINRSVAEAVAQTATISAHIDKMEQQVTKFKTR